MSKHDQIDPRVIQDLRELHDEAYEASTQGADVWRERVAQRHLFGRVLDRPPPVLSDKAERFALWVVIMVCFSLALIFVALAVTD